MPHPRPRIGLLHGFAQTGRCWATLPGALAGHFDVVAPDAPDHGPVPQPVPHRGVEGLWDAARRATEIIGPATYLGYSFGGRVALHAALAGPVAVQRLVLVSATAGIEDPADRAARRSADEALATRIERIGVAAFIDEWLSLPLFAGLDPSVQFREERLTNTAAGLARSLRTCGTGAQEPLWDRLHQITVPTLIVAGVDDERFCELARRLQEGIGENASLALVEGSGHSAHLEQPARFETLLLDWLGSNG